MSPFIHPSFVKYYALFVCVFSLLMFLMFLPLAGVGLYYIANPVATELKDFTYEDATGFGAQFSVKQENQRLLENIDMEDYIARPEYYFNIVRMDQAIRVPQITLQMITFAFIFFVALVMHWRLYRRMKGMDT